MEFLWQGTSGTISSYNYGGEVHLTNQHYDNCIRGVPRVPRVTCHVSRGTCLVLTSPRGGRTEQGYCSVSYVAYDSTSFRISNTIPSTSAAIAQIGED